jgi:hypothetical protein
VVDVSSVPMPPLTVLVPVLSSHEESPGPVSLQEKLVDTDWLTAKVQTPETGEEIDAIGGAENTDTVLSPALAVASSPADGLNATEYGSEPVENGDPDTSLSAPPDPTENTDTVLAA